MEKLKIRGRVHGTLTPAQQRRLEAVRASIAEELPDLIRRNQLAHDARKERTFSGALRRAIHQFPLAPLKIAAEAGITWRKLDGFLTGERPLPSDVIDRLVKVVRMRIPASKSKPGPGRARAS